MIGDVMRKTKAEAASIGMAGWVDKWFIDDGQIFVRPLAVDGLLRTIDKHFAQAGASQGKKSLGNEIKSTARLLCPQSRVAEFNGWATPYVEDSVASLRALCRRPCLGLLSGPHLLTRST